MKQIFTPQQMLAASQANLETLAAVASGAVARAQRLAELNLEVARGVLEDSVAMTRKLAQVRNLQELAGLQSDLAKPLIDKAVAYARSVQEISAEGQAALNKLLESRIGDLNKTFNTALDEAAKTAPAGSENVFAAVKAAMVTANNLYDNASQAARQAAQIAEANYAAAAAKAATKKR